MSRRFLAGFLVLLAFDTLGQQDSQGLFDFFIDRGLIAMPAPAAAVPAPAPTPFEATEVLRADRPGLLAYRVELGQRVKAGDVVADLIAMDGPEAFLARTPIRAGTDGFVLSRATAKFAVAGSSVAKIVGDRTFNYLVPLSLVGALYLIMTLVASGGVRLLDNWLPKQGIPLK